MRWRNTYTDINLKMVFYVFSQVSDITDVSESENLSNIGPIKRMQPPVRNADQTQKHQSIKIANDYDSETVDMTEVYNLSKKTKPPVRNADQTQKK